MVFHFFTHNNEVQSETVFAKIKPKEFSSEYGGWLVKSGCNARVSTLKIFKHHEDKVYNY